MKEVHARHFLGQECKSHGRSRDENLFTANGANEIQGKTCQFHVGLTFDCSIDSFLL